MPYYDTKFKLGQVADATGIPISTLGTYLERNYPVGSDEITGGGGTGRPRLFSFYSVMEIALAHAVIEAGLGAKGKVSYAFNAAAIFAHSDHVAALADERYPSIPCRKGATYLAVANERATVVQWIPGVDALALVRSELGRPVGFVLLDVDWVFASVCEALARVTGDRQMMPDEVLAAAYGKED